MNLPELDLEKLHQSILEYITIHSRIMFAHNLGTWDDFTSYNYDFSDLSRETLLEEFLWRILPKVSTYILTPIQKRKIEIFANHYHFERTNEGFRELQSSSEGPIEGVHYVSLGSQTQFPKIWCVVYPPEEVPKIFTGDAKILAWLSAINSSDEELANFRIYRGEELRKRLKRTWQHFKETGDLPENVNTDIAKKIVGFKVKMRKLTSLAFGKDK